MDATAIAIIPARGGSKRVASKNLLPIAGLPLLAHSVRQALAASHVGAVYVSTEDEEIAAVARDHGAEVISRPPELAGDEASSEAALSHSLDALREDPDLVVFLQCTSPVRRPGDIDAAIEQLQSERADSLFSACQDSSLFWVDGADGPKPLNYDVRARQRDQQMGDQFRENGSIYVFRPSVLRDEGSRLGGRIAIFEMDYWSSFQVDAPEHVDLLGWIMSRPEYAPSATWPDPLELVVFDFDGVLTDNSVSTTSDGDESVSSNRGDGWGIARMRDAGVPMAVLSTEAHPVVAARCEKLKLECHQDVSDKAAYLSKMLEDRGIDPANVAYVGNDENDLGCLRLVGLPTVVGDAHPSVVGEAKLVLTRPGGQGAVREFCDLALARIGSEPGS